MHTYRMEKKDVYLDEFHYRKRKIQCMKMEFYRQGI